MRKKKQTLVRDVVCGMVKARDEMKAKAVYKGKTYYFCFEGDKELFVAYPDRWLRQARKEMPND